MTAQADAFFHPVEFIEWQTRTAFVVEVSEDGVPVACVAYKIVQSCSDDGDAA